MCKNTCGECKFFEANHDRIVGFCHANPPTYIEEKGGYGDVTPWDSQYWHFPLVPNDNISCRFFERKTSTEE